MSAPLVRQPGYLGLSSIETQLMANSSQTVQNAWRDGASVIFDRSSFDFGERCIWTNQSADRVQTIDFVEKTVNWRVTFMRGIRPDPANRCSVALPIDETWSVDQKFAKRIVARKILMFAVPALVGGIALAAFAIATDDSPRGTVGPLVPLSLALVVPGIIGTIAGLAWPHLEETSGAKFVVPVEAVTDQFVCVGDAHPQFRESLPLWDRPSIHPNHTTFIAAMIKGAPIFLLLAAFAGLLIYFGFGPKTR